MTNPQSLAAHPIPQGGMFHPRVFISIKSLQPSAPMYYNPWQSIANNHDSIMTWHYLPFVRGIHQGLVDSPHKGPVKWSSMFPLAVGLNKLLTKWLISHQFEMPHPQGGVFCPMISIHHKITLAIRDSDSLQPCLFYVDSLSIQCQHITHPQLTFVAVLSEMGWQERDRSLNWQQIRYPHRFQSTSFSLGLYVEKNEMIDRGRCSLIWGVILFISFILGNITT